MPGWVSDRTGARPLVTPGGSLVAASFVPYALGASSAMLVAGLLTGLGTVAVLHNQQRHIRLRQQPV